MDFPFSPDGSGRRSLGFQRQAVGFHLPSFAITIHHRAAWSALLTVPIVSWRIGVLPTASSKLLEVLWKLSFDGCAHARKPSAQPGQSRKPNESLSRKEAGLPAVRTSIRAAFLCQNSITRSAFLTLFPQKIEIASQIRLCDVLQKEPSVAAIVLPRGWLEFG